MMSRDAAVSAIESGLCLELRYDGFSRLVEVHAVGTSKTGELCMRVYQVSGGSVSGERSGWKMMLIDKSFSAHLSTTRSKAPRPGYRKGDRDMLTIYCEL